MSVFESVLSMLNLIIIGMISIADLGSNTLYHVRLTQMTDYYNADQHGERPGQFIGRAAELLKIQGRVTVDAFRALMQGVHPASGAKLVRNALSNSRAAAWDLCHSAPKSFSVLWALADPMARHALESAFTDAVTASVRRIEEATTIRVGNGRTCVAASPVISEFVHTSGREPHDPQFHTHVVGHNVAVTEDGRSGAIVSKPLYQQNLMLGALFRCDLAAELTKRFPSMEFRATKVGFEISGVPDDVLSHFSSRSHQIAAELGGLGSETAAAKSFAALSTSYSHAYASLGFIWGNDGCEIGTGFVERLCKLQLDIFYVDGAGTDISWSGNVI